VGKSGNRIVRFQQFEIRDDVCAMKVGTDALLLGSWADIEGAGKIADLGCGSGIIALMVAQRASNAKVYGVELEKRAAIQAQQNAAKSPWSNRIHIVSESVQSFSEQGENAGTFDATISNPPYFHGKPKSPDPARNMARHDDTLSLSALLQSAKRLLKLNGTLQLIWPLDRWEMLQERCAYLGFRLEEGLGIKGSDQHSVTRVMSRWRLTNEPDLNSDLKFFSPLQHAMAVEKSLRKGGTPQFSAEYKNLLNPYILDWNGS